MESIGSHCTLLLGLCCTPCCCFTSASQGGCPLGLLSYPQAWLACPTAMPTYLLCIWSLIALRSFYACVLYSAFVNLSTPGKPVCVCLRSHNGHHWGQKGSHSLQCPGVLCSITILQYTFRPRSLPASSQILLQRHKQQSRMGTSTDACIDSVVIGLLCMMVASINVRFCQG